MKSCSYWFYIRSLDSPQIYIIQIRYERFVDRKYLCRWKENAGQSLGNPTVTKRDLCTSCSLSWNRSTKLWGLLYIFLYLQDWLAGLRFKLKWNIRHRLIVLHFNGLKKSMHNDRLRPGSINRASSPDKLRARTFPISLVSVSQSTQGPSPHCKVSPVHVNFNRIKLNIVSLPDTPSVKIVWITYFRVEPIWSDDISDLYGECDLHVPCASVRNPCFTSCKRSPSRRKSHWQRCSDIFLQPGTSQERSELIFCIDY